MSKLHSRDERPTIHEPNESQKPGPNDAVHIVASADRTGERVRSLKHGDAFAVFDHYGDIRSAQSGEEGLYYDGTRFLSRLSVEIDGARPMLLGSTVRDDNDQLTVTLTNPDVFLGNKLDQPANSLHIAKKIFLCEAACYQEIRLENYAFESVNTVLTVRFSADYMDIYEVRGMSRKERGLDLLPDVEEDKVGLHYEGLDGELRSTSITFTPVPIEISESSAEFRISLRPRETFAIMITIACKRAFRSQPPPLEIEEARSRVLAEIEQQKANSCCAPVLEWSVQCLGWSSAFRSSHDDNPAFDRTVSLCGRAVVQHPLWKGWNHHCLGVSVDVARARKRCAFISSGHASNRTHS